MDRGLTDVGLLVSLFDVEKYDFVPVGSENRWGIYMRADDPLEKRMGSTRRICRGLS
ncbi:MAG: hypothetical protein SPI25_04350 [Dialister sp.]|nr:hypothetical protein [Dialister sp.]